ncbi:MAG: hypothetical protein CM15mV106_360 [uncultured marine virus]|nr:MAG: hypothetical protein CM15mV106_360 [uncultured marine virus]
MSTKVSRVELENGEVISVEHPVEWPEEVVLAWAVNNQDQSKRTSQQTDIGPANKDDDVTTGDLIKLGLMRFGYQFVPDVFLLGPEKWRETITQEDGLQQIEAITEAEARKKSGVPVDEELTFLQELATLPGDPLSYVGVSAPVKLAGKIPKTNLFDFFKTLTPSLASGGAGVGGAMIGQELGEQYDLGQTGTALLSTGLALAGGVSAGAVTTPLVETGFKVGSDTKKFFLGESNILGSGSEAMANSQVRAEINRIAETTRPEEVARAVENLAELKQEIPGLQIDGIIATMADNPVARDWVRKTVQGNKGFQKEMEDILVSDSKKLADEADKLSGKLTGRTSADPEDYSVIRAQMETVLRKSYKERESASINLLEKQTEEIEDAMVELSTRISLDPDLDSVGIGRAANRLSEKREALIRGEADKLYDSAKVVANRVTLKPDLVQDVYSQFRNARLSDVFGPNSRVAAQLEARWMPKEVDGEVVVPKATGADIISLKKAVNREIGSLSRRVRTPEIDQRIERLYKTKGIVNSMLNKMRQTDPEFVSTLSKADKFYYEQLGLPMRAEGMRNFTSKRFDAEAATTLMDYEKAKDYVSFVGAEGAAVVRHAIRLKAEKAGVIGPDGNIQQAQLDRFIRQNKRLIRDFDMEKEFTDVSSELRTIRNTRARHQEAYNERSKELSNSFFKSIENNNLDTVVKRMKTSPGERKRYMAEISKLGAKERDIVLSGLRQEFLSQGITVKGSMQQYINANAEAVKDIFGSEYVKNINKLASLRDLMENVSKTMKDSMGSVPVIDSVQDLTGVSTSEYIGTFRNQILSPERKLINLVSKSAIVKGREKFYTKSAEILKDPDVVARLANPPKDDMLKFVKQKGAGSVDYLRDIGTFYTNALRGSLTMSTARAVYAAQDIQPTPEQEPR